MTQYFVFFAIFMLSVLLVLRRLNRMKNADGHIDVKQLNGLMLKICVITTMMAAVSLMVVWNLGL